jgi:two-component system NtrC family sensor kinase
LSSVRLREGLDILTVTDAAGNILFRTSNPDQFGDNVGDDELVSAVINGKLPVYATEIVPDDKLGLESPLLVERAYIKFIETPMARERTGTEETAGMALKAAAPIFDYQGNLIGVLYGGDLLNRNYEIVDEIKQTVFEDLKYKGSDIGTATIFQDDVRISTNVKNLDGSRAIGTRVSEIVYNQVVSEGERYIGRAYVVNNWYITAYEPIRDLNNKVVGILYVGILEQKYQDIKKQTIFVFLFITLVGVLVSLLLSYLFSRSISGPINKMVLASREVAHGNLDAKVKVRSRDEFGELADSFNSMASALKERDLQLKEFTRSKLMESERLALIGQLAANVAHELNNPLTGIITYSHLLLEQTTAEDPTKDFLQKIVNQANRCKEIIKGLLDFSRQKKPDKTLCDVNSVMMDCISLVENQALFHNIQIQSSLNIDLPRAVIDPSQIERVFMNMIINAAEAMEGSGHLAIMTRYDHENRCVEVEFTDTGSGIEKENLEKIFDPFFTTKDTGHGLGLAICYGIIKEHRGTILVESEVGKGTTFIVRLPVSLAEESDKNGNKV